MKDKIRRWVIKWLELDKMKVSLVENDQKIDYSFEMLLRETSKNLGYIRRIDSRVNKQLIRYEEQVSNQMAIGMDMGFMEESFIVVATRQSGGVVKVIDIKSIDGKEADRLSKKLKNKYGYKPVEDFPRMGRF